MDINTLQLPTKRKGSSVERFFLEITLVLVILLIMSWSPEKGLSPTSQDSLEKPVKDQDEGGLTLKQSRVAISPSGYWFDGKPVSKKELFSALKSNSIDMVSLEPRDETSWKYVSELWADLINQNYSVSLSR
ncbi:MAG: hypothetical protein ACI9YH_000151 [Colwellia sp.]|jgi:hypothetical protein